MACYYTGSAEGDARLAASEARESLTKVTAMLCEVLESLETNNLLGKAGFSDDIHKFWEKHKKKDRERKVREHQELNKKKIREKLIGQMTDEEKEAFGL